MAKKRKSYYKKRYKGVRYVNSALKKYFGKRYPVGSDRLARARAITDQIKGAGNKVILQNIFAIERIPRKSRPAPRSEKPDTELLLGIEPFLTVGQREVLFEPQPYWELVQYPNTISGLDTKLNLTFQSEVSPAGLPIISGDGTTVSYDEYFSHFVSHCNELVRLKNEKSSVKISSDNIPFKVMCTPPDENNICRIISVDEDGDAENFGFNPDQPDARPDQAVQQQIEFPTAEPPVEQKPPPAPPPPTQPTVQEQIRLRELDILEKQAEAEKAKAAAINNALDLLQKGTITHDQFDKILGSL